MRIVDPDRWRPPLRRIRRWVSAACARGVRCRSCPPLDGADVSNERATIDDIIFCYRLFLRRHPDRAGFGAYADQVRRGARVIEIASSFLSSPEWLARRLFTAAPTAADTGLRSPPRLPAGWSEAELFDLITSIRVEGGSSEELKKYARADFKR